MLKSLFKSLFNFKSAKPHSAHTESAAPVPKEGWGAFDNLDYKKALSVSQDYLRHDARHFSARMLEGASLSKLGEHDLAIRHLRKLVTDFPESASAWKALGMAAQDAKNWNLVFDSLKESLAIDPHQAELELVLGSIYFDHWRLYDARKHFENAIAIAPNATTYHNLGVLLYAAGRPDMAFEAFSHVINLDPDIPGAQRGRITALAYIAHSYGQTEKEVYSDFAASIYRQAKPLSRVERKTNERLKIRIGYLTSDFRHHPVARNMLPIFEHHDHLRFEIFVYADILKPDITTEIFQRMSDVWRDISGVADIEVARMIQADEIDILVILAGHMDRNRPQICAYRAAPVQMSLHDITTSGLKEMDYLISDIVMSPPGSKEWFSERVITLPSFYIHKPIDDSPDPGPLPALNNGYVTFGSFNNPSKLNDRTFALWSAILKAVPGSRLCLKYMGRFNEPEVREWCMEIFRSHGIKEDRLLFPDACTDRSSHLAIYQLVDIALDPFPFTGSTTTFEALWMGVPVITLACKRMVGRWSASMLCAIRHSELVANTEDEYLNIAVSLAGDFAQLGSLRENLRTRIRRSPLCNSIRRARQFERVYERVWKLHRKAIADSPLSLPVQPLVDWRQRANSIIELWQKNQEGSAGCATEELLATLPEIDSKIASELNEVAVRLMNHDALFLAVRILEHARNKGPANPAILCNIAIIYARVNQHERAIANFKQGMVLAPDFIPLMYNYAVTLQETGQFETSRSILQDVTRLNAQHLDAWMTLASVEQVLGDSKAALACAKSAFELASSNPQVHANEKDFPRAAIALGNILRDSGDIGAALDYYNRVLEIWPEHAEARLARGCIHLMHREFHLGWLDYEYRLRTDGAEKRSLGFPAWQGHKLRESTLLVLGEMGASEDILFSSCYPEIIRQAKHVVIDCEPRLQSIFSRSFPSATVLGSPRHGPPIWLNRAPHIDFKILAGSLPLALESDWGAPPVASPYLYADPLRVEDWGKKLNRLEAKIKVGLCWQGDADNAQRASHSIHIPMLSPLSKVAGITFICLQKDSVRQLETLREKQGMDIIYWEEAGRDIEELSALIDCLDLVIAPCSALALLAAALGKPVWILAPFVPTWEYSISGDTLSRYPNARVFRCDNSGNWFSVIESVATNLSSLLLARS